MSKQNLYMNLHGLALQLECLLFAIRIACPKYDCSLCLGEKEKRRRKLVAFSGAQASPSKPTLSLRVCGYKLLRFGGTFVVAAKAD